MMAGPITQALAGEVMLGRLVNEALWRSGLAYPWGDVQPLLARDIALFTHPLHQRRITSIHPFSET